MKSNCICNYVTGVVCAHHAYIASLGHVCLRCGHRRGDHSDPKFNTTACQVTNGCAAQCNGFVTLGDIKLPRGPQPPTEEAIAEARLRAGYTLRRAMSGSYSNPNLIDEALEAIAEFVWMRNG